MEKRYLTARIKPFDIEKVMMPDAPTKWAIVYVSETGDRYEIALTNLGSDAQLIAKLLRDHSSHAEPVENPLINKQDNA